MVRILIIDDDAAVRGVIEAMLQNTSLVGNVELSIATAADGEAGLAAVAELTPDVVIVDLLMPRRDGFQTCKALRNRFDPQKLELCVISGIYRDAAVVKRVESEFGARFFGKPEGLSELAVHVGHIAEQLSRKVERSGQPAASLEEPGEVAQGEDLGVRSLAAVLLDLHDAVATGRLVLRRSGVVKTIDLADGWIVGAMSSTREETLGHFLVSSGVITAEQHKRGVARAVERGEKLGQALIAAGVITQAQLSEMLVAQLRHKVVATLRWPLGTWRFQPGPVVTNLDVRIRATQVVPAGLHETATPESAREALSRLDGSSVIGLNDRGRRMLDDIRGVFGPRVSDALVAGGTVDALVGTPADDASLTSAIDVLLRCEALAIRRAAKRVVSEESSGDVAGPFDAFESGVIEIGHALDHGARARERLAVEHQRIQGLDPYGVLMVDHAATAREISAAHAALCRRFDGDDARSNGPEDLVKLDAVIAVYADARAVLLDDGRRAELDRQLGAERRASPPSFRAELAFQDAERLLASGEIAAAVAYLRAAIAKAPMEPNYHAALGWALWCLRRTPEAADEARPHLHRAVAIKPDHAVAHEYIGRIDAALGTDGVQALFHLERALMLDPCRREAMTAARDVLLR
ncbi:MAG TPA: response regulator, partial [Kofleriaceae bacterium]